jgi:hypothetical protein
VFGDAGPKEYSDDTVRDPDVIALRDRVTAQVEAAVREDESVRQHHSR